MYYQQKLDLYGAQNRIGAFFFTTILLALGALTSLELFLNERDIYIRERANGYYRAWVYYLSKILFDVIPLRVIPPILMGSIHYWMIGLRADVGNFFSFLGLLVLFNIVSGGICLIIGSVVTSVAAANILALSVVLYGMLFGGLNLFS